MAWADIDPDSYELLICCDKSENQLAQAIPGMNWAKERGLWHGPWSWAAYVCLRTAWALTPIALSPRLETQAELWWGMAQQRYADRGALDAADYLGASAKLDKIEAAENQTRKLDPVQRGGAAWLAKWGRRIPGFTGAMLVDDTGVGKTGQVIRALQLLAANGEEPYPALWVCRGAALFALRDKLAAWAPELDVRVVTGAAGARSKAILAEPRADVYLIAWPNVRLHTRLGNYPGKAYVRCEAHGGSNPKIKAGGCEVHEKELNGLGLRTVIADEAHAAKDPNSKQTRALWWLAWQADRLWPVTGTPVGDHVGDLWPLLHALAKDEHPSRSKFLDMFAERGYDWGSGGAVLGLRPEHADAFNAIVQPLIRRIPTAVARPCQPPRAEPEFRYPEMTAAQGKLYAELRDELLASLEDRVMTAANDGVRFNRLRQLATAMLEGFDAEDADGFTVPGYRLVLPSHKADDLAEFVADTPDEQIIVAAFSPQLVDLAVRKLTAAGVPCCQITGGMSPEAQHLAGHAFTSGTARVIFLTSAGGESIDLQSSHIVYWLEPNPSYRAREQVMGRADRWGQQHGVRQVHAITPGTVEQHLYDLGCEKAERAQQIMQDAALMRWLIGGPGD